MTGAETRTFGSRYQQYIPITSAPERCCRRNTLDALQSRFLFVEMEKRVPVLDASFRKARLTTGLSNRSGKEDQLMILLLVKFAHALCGRLTVLILWRRKGHR